MMRSVAPALAALLIIAASPGMAQDGESRTRLDDFAVGPGDGSLSVEQVPPGTETVQPLPQARDRAIASVPRGGRPSLRPDQLSIDDESAAPAQLSEGANPTGPIPSAGSSAADSRPQGVTRLAGSDRCDPQLPERDLLRCLRILEMRAQEFNAPAPPQLSAEESLLAAQQSDEERAMARSSDIRLRLVSMQNPDADLGSNQELASIYLDRSIPAAAAPPREELPEEAASLADILMSVTQGAPLPPDP